jgi:hypothetical protein
MLQGESFFFSGLPLPPSAVNLDCVRIKGKLSASKMAINDDKTLKETATRMGVVPIAVIKIILAGELIR